MKPLVVIAGPTGIGKSDLAVRLAKLIGGEIISADSMQVYKELNIGTAKITDEEKSGIRHHLIDMFDPDFSCDVNLYQKLVKEAIDEIVTRNKIPILCGGTGFYIQAITKDIDFSQEENDNSVRDKYESFYKEFGEDALFGKLIETDPESSQIIPKQNIKRVIRALEFYEIHGQKISEHNLKESLKKSPYNLSYFVLTTERKLLYDKIDLRVDKMMSSGLLNEVENLMDKYKYDSQSGFYNAIGYKELIDYLNGNTSYERAVELIKQNSRHYAKRQITFFKREKDAIWLDRSVLNDNEIIEQIINTLKENDTI